MEEASRNKRPNKNEKTIQGPRRPSVRPAVSGSNCEEQQERFAVVYDFGRENKSATFSFFLQPRTRIRERKKEKERGNRRRRHISHFGGIKEVGGDMFNVLSFSLRTCGFLS